jgi:hypothetical protein
MAIETSETFGFAYELVKSAALRFTVRYRSESA